MPGQLKSLMKSIVDFPEMLKLRPIVVDDQNVVLGGNMRLQAAKDAGLKSVPIIRANALTESQKKEFLIKDNVSAGTWDWEPLETEWDTQELKEWGLPVKITKTGNQKDIEFNIFYISAETTNEKQAKEIYEYFLKQEIKCKIYN